MKRSLPVAAGLMLGALAGCTTYEQAYYPAPAYVPAAAYPVYTAPVYAAPAYAVPAYPVPSYGYAYPRPYEWRGGVAPRPTAPQQSMGGA